MMKDPVGIRVARLVIAFFAIGPLLISIFIIQYPENLAISVLLFAFGAAISMGINNKRKWSWYAALIYLFLTGIGPAIYLVTTTPWYIHDVIVNPHRSRWISDVVKPAIGCIIWGFPSWASLVLLMKKSTREFFKRTETKASNQRMEAIGDPGSPQPHA